jgi:hypothetical protein
MPLEISCAVLGDRESVAAFDAFQKGVITNLVKVLGKNGDFLRTLIRAGARNDTGELVRSITKRTTNDGLTVAVKASRSQWAYVEYGVGPLGAATGKNTPLWLTNNRIKSGVAIKFPAWRQNSRLGNWATRHGLRPFSVAMGIFLRQGVRAKPFVYQPVEANKERILEEIRLAVTGAEVECFRTYRNATGNREGVTVTVGGANFDTTESGWVG